MKSAIRWLAFALLVPLAFAANIALAWGGATTIYTVFNGGAVTNLITAPSFEATNSGGSTRALGMSGQTTFISFISTTRIGLYYAGVLKHDFQSGEYSNTTGVERLTEVAAPTLSAGADVLYADSTAHALRASYNNDAAANVARAQGAAQSGAYTNATTGFTTVTGVSVSLGVGQWMCKSEARFTESTGADGAQFKVASTAGTISGGGASTFADGEQYDATALADSKDAATESVTTTDATVSAGHVAFRSAVNVATTMTYVLQGAQVAHSTGTLTVSGGAINCVHL